MNEMDKQDIIDEILMHLEKAQGMGFKKSYDDSMKPKMDPMQEDKGPEMDEMEGMEKPKGIAVEKVEVMKPKSFDDKANEAISEMDDKDDKPGMPGSDDEMSDDELSEMIDEMMKRKKI